MSEEMDFTKTALSENSYASHAELGNVKVTVASDNNKTTFYNAQISDGAITVSVSPTKHDGTPSDRIAFFKDIKADPIKVIFDKELHKKILDFATDVIEDGKLDASEAEQTKAIIKETMKKAGI